MFLIILCLGHGIAKYSNGDSYEGNFKDDVKSGEGVYEYACGDVYDGQWKDNKKNGNLSVNCKLLLL